MPKVNVKKKSQPKRTTAKDMPGSGMAKKAAQAIEENRRKKEKMMKELFK